MSTRSQSWLSFVSDERVPKQALPGSRRYLSWAALRAEQSGQMEGASRNARAFADLEIYTPAMAGSAA
jgi:hypothetical protein